MQHNHISEPFENIRSVLVVLSSRAMTVDMPALRNLIMHAYPNTAVFFISTSGDPMGSKAPEKVDLVIDFTPPGARQSFRFARKMISCGKHTVGRNAGWFVRKTQFTRVFDEISAHKTQLPKDYLEAEAFVQRKVLELAGVPMVRQGGVGQDRGKSITLDNATN